MWFTMKCILFTCKRTFKNNETLQTLKFIPTWNHLNKISYWSASIKIIIDDWLSYWTRLIGYDWYDLVYIWLKYLG